MTRLDISVVAWTDAGRGSAEQTTTSALLRIDAGDLCLTRNESEWSRSVSEHVHVSAYPAALWFVGNWWRLCFEPEPSDLEGAADDADWRTSHQLAAAGSGFLWPPIVFAPDGEHVFVRSRPGVDDSAPIRYQQSPEIAVPVAAFEHAVGSFVDTVVERLRERNVVDSDLQLLWEEVKAERLDGELSRARRFEALLHCDPDEAPDDSLTAIQHLADRAGLEAAREVAAALPRERSTTSLARLKAAAENGEAVEGRWRPPAELVGRARAITVDSSRAPWERGMEVARLVRAEWGLGSGPLDSRELAQRLQLPEDVFRAASGTEQPMSLAIDRGGEVAWLLRSRRPPARRFETARLLGDVLTSPPGDGWHPATELRTARQKIQRAFAAEFLCPAEGLRQFLRGNRSWDAVGEAADFFDVNEKAVEHQLENHVRRPR